MRSSASANRSPSKREQPEVTILERRPPIARDVEDSHHPPVGSEWNSEQRTAVPSQVVADGLGSDDVVDADSPTRLRDRPGNSTADRHPYPGNRLLVEPDRGPHAELRALGVGQE